MRDLSHHIDCCRGWTASVKCRDSLSHSGLLRSPRVCHYLHHLARSIAVLPYDYRAVVRNGIVVSRKNRHYWPGLKVWRSQWSWCSPSTTQSPTKLFSPHKRQVQFLATFFNIWGSHKNLGQRDDSQSIYKSQIQNAKLCTKINKASRRTNRRYAYLGYHLVSITTSHFLPIGLFLRRLAINRCSW
jgi:hypothetical protein